MIRHFVAHPFVAHPFGAAVGRSSQLAALLESCEGAHPPSSTSALPFPQKQKTDHQVGSFKFGGEGGIRTLDTLPYTHFPGVLLQPLGHLTKFLLL